MKKLIAFLIIISTVVSLAGFAATTTETVKNEVKEIEFSDVDKSTTQGKAIYKLAKKGIILGYGDNTFRPQNPITRAELCKIVNMAFAYTEAAEDNFKDVKKEDWFYPYVAIAKKAGYIAGHDDGTFRGDDFLTREQACVIVTRVAGLYEIPFIGAVSDEISTWAIPYVNKVLGNRLMTLEEGNTFRATQNITREELTVVIANFVKEDPVVSEPDENLKTKYTVTVSDSKGVIKDAVVSEAEGKITVKLPATYSLSTSSQLTVKVLSADGKAVSNISVTVSDSKTSKTSKTDSTGTAKFSTGNTGGGGGGVGSGGGSNNSSGNNNNSGNKDPEKVDYSEQNDEVVKKLSKAKSQLQTASFEPVQKKIINIVIEVIDDVIADKAEYLIAIDSIYSNYTSEIEKAVSMYAELSQIARNSFVNKVSQLDKETFKFLEDFFGVSFEIIEDKLEEKEKEETTKTE